MARVTVEDCVEKVSNRFELVMVAAQRSREISSGAEPRVERDRDKNPVVALREIAEEKASPEELYNGLVQSLQRHVEVDEPEEDGFDAMASDPEFAGIGEGADDTAPAPPPPSAAQEESPAVEQVAEAPATSAPETEEHPPVSYEDTDEDDSKG